jgi:hypothetical protein
VKIGKNKILALSLALLITLPIAAMSASTVNADESELRYSRITSTDHP